VGSVTGCAVILGDMKKRGWEREEGRRKERMRVELRKEGKYGGFFYFVLAAVLGALALKKQKQNITPWGVRKNGSYLTNPT
jgi:hypothetical protein